jgi:hypothetical protein
MSEMIKRVARVLHETRGGGGPIHPDTYEEARAVLLAMREPTEDMIAPNGNTLAYFDHHRNDDAAAIWRAMIDAELERTPRPSVSIE